MPISVRKLAQLLGVSPASVSLALNGKPGVSEETREKILAAALQHGLKPVSAPAAVRKSSDITLAVYRKHGSICGDTEFFSAVDAGDDLGRVEQRLGRDTAAVEAGAADLAVLDHRGLEPALGGMERGDIAAGTRADDKQLIIRHNRWYPFLRQRRTNPMRGAAQTVISPERAELPQDARRILSDMTQTNASDAPRMVRRCLKYPAHAGARRDPLRPYRIPAASERGRTDPPPQSGRRRAPRAAARRTPFPSHRCRRSRLRTVRP